MNRPKFRFRYSIANNKSKSNDGNDTSMKNTFTCFEESKPNVKKPAAVCVVLSKSNIPKPKNTKLKPAPGKRKPEETETR